MKTLIAGPFLLAVAILTCTPCHAGETAEADKATPKKKDEPTSWIIRSYRIPPSALEKIDFPAMPTKESDADAIEAFIKSSTEVARLFLESHNVLLPEGSLAVYDSKFDTLAVRTTEKYHQLIKLYEKSAQEELPIMLGFRVDIVEADTSEILDLIESAAGSKDHTPLLEGLEKLAGKGKLLASTRFDTKPGQTVKIENVSERSSGVGFRINEREIGGVINRRSQDIGLTVELQPVFGSDGSTIDLRIDLECQLAQATPRIFPFTSPKGKRVFIPVIDPHIARVKTNKTLMDGQCRLLGIWQAVANSGDQVPERKVAAFITGHVVQMLAAERPLALNLLKEYGERVTPTPPPVPPKPREEPALAEEKGPDIYNRVFQIPPNFLDYGDRALQDGDPFSEEDPFPKARLTAKDVLEAHGVTFPPGATTFFGKSNSVLTVANTAKNMEKIEAFVDSITNHSSRQLQCQLHIVQANGSTLRQLDRASLGSIDHSKMWQSLQKEMEAGGAKLIHTGWLGTNPGQTASSSAVTEFSIGRLESISKKDGIDSAEVALKTQNVGLEWEVQAVLYEDLAQLVTSLSLDTAQPSEKFAKENPKQKSPNFGLPEVEFHKSELKASLTLAPGTKRLIGMWKPKGTSELDQADVLHAAFIEVDVIEVK